MSYNQTISMKNRRNYSNQVNRMSVKATPPRSRRRTRRPKALEVITVVIFLTLICILSFIFTVGMASGDRNFLSTAQAYARQTQQAMAANPTPTPFQPIADEEDLAKENEFSSIPELSNVFDQTTAFPNLEKPDKQLNILLLGSDVRPNDGGFRTDVIVWVSLNPKDGFVSAISFPRDLYVQIPNRGENRINTAFPAGGFEMMADTFELNFGVRPDNYILVDFNGFTTVIDQLGGIDVQATKNLSDSCATWVNPSGWCSVGPGLVQMDGEMALWYARSRYSTSDVDRARRAQEVIEAIFDRLMSLDAVLRAPDLYNTYTTYVQTDISLDQVIAMLPLAKKINQDRDIRNYVVGFDLAYSWMTMGGASVLVPDIEGIRNLMIEALMLE